MSMGDKWNDVYYRRGRKKERTRENECVCVCMRIYKRRGIYIYIIYKKRKGNKKYYFDR